MNFHATPLEIFGVYDRGVPGLERIVLRATGQVDLRAYYMMLGAKVALSSDHVYPLADHCLWLGEHVVAANSWVFVYTGTGINLVTTESNTMQPVQAIYWQKPSVVLANPDVLPFLVTAGNLQIGNKPNKTISDIWAAAQQIQLPGDNVAKLSEGMQKG